MNDLPSIEEFLELAEAEKRYRAKCTELIEEYFDKDPEAPINMAELATHCLHAHRDAVESALQQGEAANNWLINQPGIQLALARLGFLPGAGGWREGMYQNEIAMRVAKVGADEPRYKSSSSLSYSFSRPERSQFIRYVSGLSNAVAGYLSRSRVKAALEGHIATTRLRELLSEFEDIVSSDWIAAPHRNALNRRVGNVKGYLDRNDITGNSPARSRNDPFLPTRLFITDLYRLHMDVFRKPCKRVIYELSALPFIENPPEDMVSIRRIIQAERTREAKERTERTI